MYYEYECETCDREFSSEHAASQHMNALNHWGRRYDCETCDREFRSQYAADQHMDDTGHWMPQFECETCNRRFHTQNSANQHMNNMGHWAPQFECQTCNRRFHTQNSANQHMDDTGHWAPQVECQTCVRRFHTQSAANQHMNDTGHWAPRFECESCDRRFHSQSSADQHMDALNHWRGHYCRDCDRQFQNANALKMHLNSSIHRGTNVACPFCKLAFTSASGLSHHLETGSCPQAGNLNREVIYKAIKERDPSGLVTKKLLTYPDFTTRNIATVAAWNGHDYECYLCHRQYDTLQGLNQHLNSPAHSEKLYHCPNRACGRGFVSLAALFNHLESESCNFVRFEKVQQNVHGFITGRQKLIGFM